MKATATLAVPVTTTVSNSFGNTIYRCPSCGIDLWGAPVTYHSVHYPDHASMQPIGSHQYNRYTKRWSFVPWRRHADGTGDERPLGEAV